MSSPNNDQNIKVQTNDVQGEQSKSFAGTNTQQQTPMVRATTNVKVDAVAREHEEASGRAQKG